MHHITLLLLIAILSTSTQGAETTYTFEAKKPEDSIIVANDPKRTPFIITCKSGIGSGSITLASGAWPKHVSLRLAGFTSLEAFSLKTARLWIQGSLRESGKMPFYLADAAGKFDTADHFAGYLEIVVEQRNGGLEIILPANLLADSTKFEVSWIDAYRR